MKKPRKLIEDALLTGVMRVPVAGGATEIIDAADAEEVGKHCWSMVGKYAVTMGPRPRRKRIFLHVMIATNAGMDTSHEVDHKNTVTLDCRRENLRSATSSQNKCNSTIRSDNTSGRKGVSFDKSSGKWKAYINKDGNRISLGCHARREAAEELRSYAEVALHGEFARPR